MKKPFKYKIPRGENRPAPFGSINRKSEDEQLTGSIGGNEASDIEERFARGLYKDARVSGFSFREPVISARNLPGQLEVDFLIQSGPQLIPVQVDGEYAHKGISKKQDDARKDAMVDEYYKLYGARPVKRIDGARLQNQEDADRVVRSLLS